jgi:hypothetical protein
MGLYGMDVCPGCAGKDWLDVFIPTADYVSWIEEPDSLFMTPMPDGFSGDRPELEPLPVQSLLRDYGLRPKKGLGQNFLVDDTYCSDCGICRYHAARMWFWK